MNNYSLHSVVSMADRIRSNPSLNGMVTSVGWYMTKHAVVVYGKKPGKISWVERTTDEDLQKEVDRQALPEPVEKAEGPLTVEAYTVIHGRKGNPKQGIVMGRLKDGKRAIAEIDGDGEVLLQCEETELFGKTGAVRFDSELIKNRVKFENLK
jgi:acetyl-CoA C-acetyltransferase